MTDEKKIKKVTIVCLSCFVRDKSEPEAIQILQAIEKELEGRNET